LLSVVILYFRSERRCDIDIVSGGGKESGWFGLHLDRGYDSLRTGEIIRLIQTACESQTWTLTRESPSITIN
jgi:hypothetical protein